MRALSLLLAVACCSLPACRDGGGKHEHGEDAGPGVGPNTTPAENTIYEIQGGLPVGTSVRLEGVIVTAVDTFGARGGELFVQEPGGGPFSGISVSDVEITAGVLAPGDIVTITGGVVDEFALDDQTGRTVTEISAPTRDARVTVTRTGHGEVPAPQRVDIAALAASAGAAEREAEAEKWEGVLIRIENVAVVSPPHAVDKKDPTLKEMTVTGPFQVASSLTAFDGVDREACFASITGLGDYFFSYKLLPRSAEDLVLGGDCLPAEAADLCGNGNDDDLDGFSDCDDRSCQESVAACTAESTVQSIQKGDVEKGARVRLTSLAVTAVAKKYVWVQDPAGGPYSGIVAFFKDGVASPVVPGDLVTLEGIVAEYKGLTELEGPTLTVTGTGTVPAPADVDLASLSAPQTAELWEGVLVRVAGGVAQGVPDEHGTWFLSGTGGVVAISDLAHSLAPAPTKDECFTSLTGVLGYSFDQFELIPRSAADVVRGCL